MSSPTASEVAPAIAARNDAGDARLAIQLDDVSVRYRVPRERVPSFKDYAIRWLKGRLAYREFWALRGVSLSVQRGEVFGIIGHNGAGKSTLLKLVARVLRPTAGRVRVRGRVAPLIELGAGFDHELTGRENVFLNGALLGFSRADIAERFQRIVDFAGVSDFIDRPLRTYSSGMVARLAFSVATDVTPEVLLVDEVLSVGDAEFQKKSSERIRALRSGDQSILMVTHSLTTVREMCERVAWLDHGHLLACGPAEEVVRRYEEATR